MDLRSWDVAVHDYPTESPVAEQLRFVVRYALLAPSGHNTQPWRFAVSDEAISLWADRARSLPVVDPEDRELTMSCGAALYNLRVALGHFGFIHGVELLPDPGRRDLLARVRITGRRGGVDPVTDALFPAILERHTHRLPYPKEPVQPSLVAALRQAAAAEGAGFVAIEGEAREALAGLVAEGDRRQAADPAFRRELSAWVTSNLSHRRDGIPGYALGFSTVPSLIGASLLHYVDWGQRQAARDRRAALEAPLVAVISTGGDDPIDWLRAGQALERVLLTATVSCLSAAFLNQPVEIPELRERLAALTGAGTPQLVLRLGHAPPHLPTPRRDLSDVLA
jgi:hypothetical protein